jgi:hypothetical protein
LLFQVESAVIGAERDAERLRHTVTRYQIFVPPFLNYAHVFRAGLTPQAESGAGPHD